VLLPHEGVFRPVALAIKQKVMPVVGQPIDRRAAIWSSVKIEPHFDEI
jgi:hypothetical protein